MRGQARSASVIAMGVVVAVNAYAKKPITPDERAIVTAFDAAVRAPDPLKSLSKLQWARDAVLVNPQFLSLLSFCQRSMPFRLMNGKLAGSWEDCSSPAHNDGYLVELSFKDGSIKRAQVEEMNIVVTSGRMANG